MKHIAFSMALMITGVLMTLAILTYTMRTDKRSDLDSALKEACEDAVSETMDQNVSYSLSTDRGREELVAAFLQNLSLRVDSDTDLHVKVLGADAEKGLLKVKVKESFNSVGGKREDYEATCTAILEQPLDVREMKKIAWCIPVTDDKSTIANEEEEMNETLPDGGIELKKSVYSAISDYIYDTDDFSTDYQDCVITTEQEVGNAYKIPTPTMDGYEFLGWYLPNGSAFTDNTGTPLANFMDLKTDDNPNGRDECVITETSPTVLYGRFKKTV